MVFVIRSPSYTDEAGPKESSLVSRVRTFSVSLKVQSAYLRILKQLEGSLLSTCMTSALIYQ